VPCKVDDDCLRELRWLYDRRDLAEARRDLAAWLAKWQATYPKLGSWVEGHIEETLAAPRRPPRSALGARQAFYRLPRQHHNHLKSTNLLERLNEEIKRRTHPAHKEPSTATITHFAEHSGHNCWGWGNEAQSLDLTVTRRFNACTPSGPLGPTGIQPSPNGAGAPSWSATASSTRLICTAHFPLPSVGRIVAAGAAFRLVEDDPKW
jgi:hypothetical protein